MTIAITMTGRGYVGQCIEHDFAFSGSTMGKLRHAFRALLNKHREISALRGLPNMGHLPPAPDVFRGWPVIVEWDD